MKRFTSNDEIENLCEAMIKDFFKSKHYTNVMCVDIEAFVREYLGVPIVYETFAEPDPGRVGFLSDGKRPLMVRRDGKVEEIVFPPRTAVIEKFLLSPKESARKRFTIAHEGAHDVMGRHIMTSNAPDTYYTQLLENYRQTLSRFVGPARVLVSGNTLQLKDYGRTDWEWTLFDPEDKRIRHETVFPQECKKAFEMGKELAGE